MLVFFFFSRRDRWSSGLHSLPQPSARYRKMQPAQNMLLVEHWVWAGFRNIVLKHTEFRALSFVWDYLWYFNTTYLYWNIKYVAVATKYRTTCVIWGLHYSWMMRTLNTNAFIPTTSRYSEPHGPEKENLKTFIKFLAIRNLWVCITSLLKPPLQPHIL